VTNAAIDKTLASGANVAAMRGIAVEANHQSLPASQQCAKDRKQVHLLWFVVVVGPEAQHASATDMGWLFCFLLYLTSPHTC